MKIDERSSEKRNLQQFNSKHFIMKQSTTNSISRSINGSTILFGYVRHCFRFVGFICEWPSRWNDIHTYVYVGISLEILVKAFTYDKFMVFLYVRVNWWAIRFANVNPVKIFCLCAIHKSSMMRWIAEVVDLCSEIIFVCLIYHVNWKFFGIHMKICR